MIKLFRKIYRLIILIFWFIFCALYALPSKWGGWNKIRRASNCSHLWGKGIARIMNLQLNIHGSLDDFSGGLIVSNHSSYMDIITHAAIFSLRFSPKIEIKNWPVLGFVLGLSRPLWVDRRSRQKSKDLKAEIEATMKHGIPMIVYPEGTTSDNRGELLPFKSTPFEAVVGNDYEVLPVVTIFHDTEDGKTIAWYGDAELLPHVWHIIGYKKIEISIFILPKLHSENLNRKELADKVYKLISSKFNEEVVKICRSAKV